MPLRDQGRLGGAAISMDKGIGYMS